MNALYMFPPSEAPSEDVDLSAGEYALGVLDPGEAAAIRLRAEADPALRRAIALWQSRLAYLTAMLPLAALPETSWTRIEAAIGAHLPATPQAPSHGPTPPPADPPQPEVRVDWPPEPAPGPAETAPISPAAALEPAPVIVLPPAPPLVPLSLLPAPPTSEAPLPATSLAPFPATSHAPIPATPPPLVTPKSASRLPPAPPAKGGIFGTLAELPPASADTSTVAAPRFAMTLRHWQFATAAAVGLAAVLGAVLVMPGSPPMRGIAAIGPVSAPAPLFLAETDGAGRLKILPLATIAVPAGRDLELWSLPPDASPGTRPISLGVLPAAGRVLSLGGPPPEGTQLLVSMEPRGGSGNGQISGPVLYGGVLANH